MEHKLLVIHSCINAIRTNNWENTEGEHLSCSISLQILLKYFQIFLLLGVKILMYCWGYDLRRPKDVHLEHDKKSSLNTFKTNKQFSEIDELTCP